MKYCPKCNKLVDNDSNSCICGYNDDDGSSFLLSLAMGIIADNAIVGGLLGGDILGGIVGDLINDGDIF